MSSCSWRALRPGRRASSAPVAAMRRMPFWRDLVSFVGFSSADAWVSQWREQVCIGMQGESYRGYADLVSAGADQGVECAVERPNGISAFGLALRRSIVSSDGSGGALPGASLPSLLPGPCFVSSEGTRERNAGRMRKGREDSERKKLFQSIAHCRRHRVRAELTSGRRVRLVGVRGDLLEPSSAG